MFKLRLYYSPLITLTARGPRKAHPPHSTGAVNFIAGNAVKSLGSATPAIKALLAAAPAQKCGPAPNGIASPVFL